MRMKTSYYPETISGRADWWQNKIDNAALLTQLVAALAPDIQNDAKSALYLYRTLPLLYDKFTVDVHGYINSYLTGADGTPAPAAPTVPAWPTAPDPAVLTGVEARRMRWVQTIKNSAGYNPDTNGQTLLLETGSGPFQPDDYQAVIVSAVSLAPGQVSAKFRKARGAITGMAFSGHKSGSANVVDLGRFTVSPASLHIPIGTPGQAEVWEIWGQALKGDTLIGKPSDHKEVLVRG